MPLSRPGDIVISHNPKTGAYEYRRVVDPMNPDSEPPYALPATDLDEARASANFALSGEQRVFTFDTNGQLHEYVAPTTLVEPGHLPTDSR
jgi:hypothetical protein